MDVHNYLAVLPHDPSYDPAGGVAVATTDGVQAVGTTPIDNASMVYTFSADGAVFELNSYLESDQQNWSKTSGDGGDNDAVYEIGTASPMTLIN
jgi:hypothetical protein